MSEKCCPKCGSNNINFQREQTVSVGGSLHTFCVGKHHGVMYWVFIGWWLWILKLCFEMFRWVIMLCTLGLIGRKRKKGIRGKTISANKSINRTMAVCQNCGYSWKA
jgi:hypothetical protein